MNPTEPISVIESLPIIELNCVKINANEGAEDSSEINWEATTDQQRFE